MYCSPRRSLTIAKAYHRCGSDYQSAVDPEASSPPPNTAGGLARLVPLESDARQHVHRRDSCQGRVAGGCSGGCVKAICWRGREFEVGLRVFVCQESCGAAFAGKIEILFAYAWQSVREEIEFVCVCVLQDRRCAHTHTGGQGVMRRRTRASHIYGSPAHREVQWATTSHLRTHDGRTL